MKKLRTLVVLAVLALSVSFVSADNIGWVKISATTTAVSRTFSAGTKDVTIVNDGSGAVYFTLQGDKATPETATAGSKEIKSGEGFTFSFRQDSRDGLDGSTYYAYISVVSDATATVRIFAK